MSVILGIVIILGGLALSIIAYMACVQSERLERERDRLRGTINRQKAIIEDLQTEIILKEEA